MHLEHSRSRRLNVPRLATRISVDGVVESSLGKDAASSPRENPVNSTKRPTFSPESLFRVFVSMVRKDLSPSVPNNCRTSDGCILLNSTSFARMPHIDSPFGRQPTVPISRATVPCPANETSRYIRFQSRMGVVALSDGPSVLALMPISSFSMLFDTRDLPTE